MKLHWVLPILFASPFFILSFCIDKNDESKTHECYSLKLPHGYGYIERFNFDNHSYVIWTGTYKGAMVHDPDCKCKKEK